MLKLKLWDDALFLILARTDLCVAQIQFFSGVRRTLQGLIQHYAVDPTSEGVTGLGFEYFHGCMIDGAARTYTTLFDATMEGTLILSKVGNSLFATHGILEDGGTHLTLVPVIIEYPGDPEELTIHTYTPNLTDFIREAAINCIFSAIGAAGANPRGTNS